MKPGLNMGGPSSKTKYSCTTDSESVRRLKDDKHPDKGSERVPETVCLQAVGAPPLNGSGENVFYVYVLQNVQREDEFYIGWSADLRRRFDEHQSGRNSSTRGRTWRLVYYEAYLSAAAARQREKTLKHDGRVRRFLMDRIKRSL